MIEPIINSLIGFFMSPFNAGILIVSLALALITFFYWKESNKVGLIYLHISFLIFPLLYYAIAVPCSVPFIKGLISFCSIVITRLIIFLIPVTLLGAVVLGYFVAPSFYKKINKARAIENKFIQNKAKQFGLKLKVYLVDKAKPLAFSFRKSIFISVGMFEILNKKELEAVLLHELGHIYYKSSISKFSVLFIRVTSPLSKFTTFKERLNLEERKADAFATHIQRNSRFINKAKNKVEEFSKFL